MLGCIIWMLGCFKWIWMILLSFIFFCLRFFLFRFLCDFSFFLLPSRLRLTVLYGCCTDATVSFPLLLSFFLFIAETFFCPFICFLPLRLLTRTFSQTLWSLLWVFTFIPSSFYHPMILASDTSRQNWTPYLFPDGRSSVHSELAWLHQERQEHQAQLQRAKGKEI